MTQRPRVNWGPVLALGALWGIAEAGLGMGLRQCAAFVSGAVMTGAALFFIAAGRAAARSRAAVPVMVAIAAGLKLFDALLLGLPVLHGAVGNPIFAFAMEGAAFLLVFGAARAALANRIPGRALLGGFAALLAVNLFPLVKHATGVPACVVPGTGYPLSLYYAPIAIALSALTVPLGLAAGDRIAVWAVRLRSSPGRLSWLVPAAAALGPGVIALLRLF